MTTNAVVTEQTTDVVPIVAENVTRRVYTVGRIVKDKETNEDVVEYYKYEQVAVQDFDKWEKLDKNKLKVLATNKDGVPAEITSKEYSVNTLEALLDLVGDAEEAASIVNRGLSQKTSAGVVKMLTETNDAGELVYDFAGAPIYDTLEIIQKISNRRLSPTEKAEKGLVENLKTLGFDPDAFRQYLAQMQAAQQ